ncbi:MAG: sigma-70 family RNA polymerase sigma factor [Chitinophagaceae bacterium]|nr:sigma-70 family RNA polymerase sigma factor [Chitinophagaceae bacterium]
MKETAYAPSLLTAVDPAELSVFDTLYHQYHHAVYSNIYKLIGQKEAAEDILQEVFLALWERRHKLDTARVAGWLFVTSYNKSLKYLKKKSRENAVHLSDDTLYEVQEDVTSEDLYSLRVSMIEDAVNHLPERKKQVFKLCRYEGRSCDEVARMLDLSPGSVKDYLKQANRQIKDYIFSHYAEASLGLTPLLLVFLQ